MSRDREFSENIQTRIWEEEAEADNPFAAEKCYCSGYDVFGELLGKISWIEYLYLLFKGEQPTSEQVKLLEGVAIAIANPGPRDHSVRASMNAAVTGGASASCLIAAAGVGAGCYGGAREVYEAHLLWQKCNSSIESFKHFLSNLETKDRQDVWPDMEHVPGFDPYGVTTATPIRQVLSYLSQHNTPVLNWINDNKDELEKMVGYPIAMAGVISAALLDIGFREKQAEMLYLLLRLPGAAVHGLEQREFGWRKYPLFLKGGLALENDPGPKGPAK